MSGRRPNGSGTLRTDGYRQLKAPGHPLARGEYGTIYEHRMVLYNKIGPGPHPCHWCEVLLDWGGPAGLQADHLNNDRSDNRSENLVPSCPGCNSGRAEPGKRAYNRLKTHCPHGHPYDEENTGWRKDGRRYCRMCWRERRLAWGKKNVDHLAEYQRKYGASKRSDLH